MGEFRQKWVALNPLLRTWIYVICSIIILVILLEAIISIWGDTILARHLKKKINRTTAGTYSIQFKDLDLSLPNSSATFHKVQIHSDAAAFRRSFSPSQKPPDALYRGVIGKIKISGFHLFSALWGKTLHIRQILIKNPDITVLKNPHPPPADTSEHFSSVDSSIYADISQSYKTLKINKLAVRNAHVVSMQSEDTVTSLGKVNLTLKNIRVDSASARSGRMFVTDDIALDAHRLMMKTSNNLNKIALKRFVISSEAQTILLDSLRLIPRYPKFKYSEKNGTQIDRINLSIDTIALRHVDFTTFVRSGKFHSGYTEIDRARLQDFHSKIPPSPPPAKKSLYNAKLLHLSQKIKLDSIKVKNSYVSYAEYHAHAPRAGKVTFKNISATFRNVTNYPKAIAKDDSIKVYAKANVMGKGLLQVHWTFPLDTHNAFHKIHGTLSTMPLTAFNPILKYVAFVKVDHGKLNSMKFHFTGNDDRSSGTLIMNYQNLKVSVLKKKTAKQQGLLKNIFSFAANKFIVETNNTPKNGMRAGKINFKRDKDKSSWNFWWKSLLSGIKSSIK